MTLTNDELHDQTIETLNMIAKSNKDQQDRSEIKYFDCCEGDSNDVFRRFILKGTMDQVDKYLYETIRHYYNKQYIENLDFGYAVSVQNEDISDFEYYIEAYLPELSDEEVKEIESYSIEEYNKRFFYHKIIDLTEKQEVLNQ